MRHSPTLLLLVLVARVAQGQTPPSSAEVKQVLREALTVQAPAPAALPHLPERVSEPARAEAPAKKPTQAPAPQLSGEVLERAGRMATHVPASAPKEPTRMKAVTNRAAAASQAAAGQSRAEQVRQQRPPRPGTPGGRPQPSPPLDSPVGPRSTTPPSASSIAPGSAGH